MNLIGTVNASGNIFYQKGLSFVSSSETALKLEVGTEDLWGIHTSVYALNHHACTVRYMFKRSGGGG